MLEWGTVTRDKGQGTEDERGETGDRGREGRDRKTVEMWRKGSKEIWELEFE